MKIPTGDIDLNKVETGVPIIKPGDYEVKVSSMETVPTASGGERLKIRLSLEEEAHTRDGDPVSPGFPIFASASITPTDKYTLSDIVKMRLVPLMDCFLGERPKGGFDTDDFVGKVGRVRVIIRNDDVYGESNEVKAYLPQTKKGKRTRVTSDRDPF